MDSNPVYKTKNIIAISSRLTKVRCSIDQVKKYMFLAGCNYLVKFLLLECH